MLSNDKLQKVLNWVAKYNLSSNDVQYIEKFDKLETKWDPFPELIAGVSWENKLPLQNLFNLKRKSISGPVQEDKSEVFEVLSKLIRRETKEYTEFDLNKIFGLYDYKQKDDEFITQLEQLVLTKKINNKILSLQDFNKALNSFKSLNSEIEVRKMGWFGEKYYLMGDIKNAFNLINLIVYARHRKFNINDNIAFNKVIIKTYNIDSLILVKLLKKYQIYNIPHDAWSDKVFMNFLLDQELAYARFSFRTDNIKLSEWMFLPKTNTKSLRFGLGLKLSGAYDVLTFLNKQVSIQNNFNRNEE